MAHITKNDGSLVVQIRTQEGTNVAVFECLDENELTKLAQAESLKPPVFVAVRNLRLFIGNAVIVVTEEGVFV